MSSDPTLDFPQCPFGEFDFGKAISFTFDDDDAEPHFEQDSERPDWGDLPVAWDIFGADSLCNSEGNSVVEFPDAIEPNDAIEPLYNVKDVIEPNDATGVDAPSLTPKTTLKRVFVPSNGQLFGQAITSRCADCFKKIKIWVYLRLSWLRSVVGKILRQQIHNSFKFVFATVARKSCCCS